jgi:hypothetical protein
LNSRIAEAKLKKATKKSSSSRISLTIHISLCTAPTVLSACQEVSSCEPCPLSVSVPITSSTAVEARKVAAIVELRRVCTARMSLLPAMTFSTQAVRAMVLTACTV